MRLLNAKTEGLEEFDHADTPPYAILSHTWTKGQEISFAEWEDHAFGDRSGYHKITSACRTAVANGLSYIWVDTCCIDKRSSAELSEAINSMFAWYKNAVICFAFLDDVTTLPDGGQLDKAAVQGCRWWTRGWTLQELIAPVEVKFYDNAWNLMFTRTEEADLIRAVTGIDRQILLGEAGVQTASVAKRMSWAAGRTTTRPEDAAYCLMGLFDVNMSMLYGEGANAFLRLQEQIIKYSDDQSVFAWTHPPNIAPAISGLLAPSAVCFRDSADFIPFVDSSSDAPFVVTNKGMNINLRLSRVWGRLYRAELCCRTFHASRKCLCIFLEKQSKERSQFVRVNMGQHYLTQGQGKLEHIYVRQSPVPSLSTGPSLYVFMRRGPDPSRYKLLSLQPHLPKAVYMPFEAGLLRRKSETTDGSWIPEGTPYRWLLQESPGSIVGAMFFSHIESEEEMVILLTSSWETGLCFGSTADRRLLSMRDSLLWDQLADIGAQTADTILVHNDRHSMTCSTEWSDEPWGITCYVDLTILDLSQDSGALEPLEPLGPLEPLHWQPPQSPATSLRQRLPSLSSIILKRP